MVSRGTEAIEEKDCVLAYTKGCVCRIFHWQAIIVRFALARRNRWLNWTTRLSRRSGGRLRTLANIFHMIGLMLECGICGLRGNEVCRLLVVRLPCQE